MAVLLILCIATAELLAQEMDPLTTLPTIVVTTGTGVNKLVDKAFKKAFSLEKILNGATWIKSICPILSKMI